MNVKCSVEWCDRKAENRNGFCKKHHHQFVRHGKILSRTTRDPNEIRDVGTHLEIDLYDKNGEKTTTMLLSKESYDLIKGKKIRLSKIGYPTLSYGKISKYVHKIILPVKNGNYVDHINHIRTDNRLENLREVTPTQSAQNMEALGCTYSKERKKWRVNISVQKKTIYLGQYNTKEVAIREYRKAVKHYFGEYAYNYKE